MQNRPLDHPLEARSRRGIALLAGLKRLIFLIEVLLHDIPEVAKLDPAGLHHGGSVGIVDQREQQVLQRGVLVAAIRGMSERGMQGLFKVLGKTGHLWRLSCSRFTLGRFKTDWTGI